MSWKEIIRCFRYIGVWSWNSHVIFSIYCIPCKLSACLFIFCTFISNLLFILYPDFCSYKIKQLQINIIYSPSIIVNLFLCIFQYFVCRYCQLYPTCSRMHCFRTCQNVEWTVRKIWPACKGILTYLIFCHSNMI